MIEEALRGVAPRASRPTREPPRRRLGACFATGGVLPRLWRSERGTAVVEFALVALPLFLIVFGILDFGRALNYYNDLTQIGGQGARAAAVNQNPLGGPADANFQHQLACEGTSGELRKGINVSVTTMPVNVGDPVTVTATFTFHFIPVLKLANLTLTAAQTERYEAAGAPSYSQAFNPAGVCP